MTEMNLDDYEMIDDVFDDDEFERPPRRRPTKDVARRGQKPIENADQIPLFRTADKAQVNTVSYINVIKTSRPDHGYKGQLPPNSTQETLLRTYGPGTYTLEGCNDRHQIIIEQHEVTISGSTHTPGPSNNKAITTDSNAELAIKMANHQAEQSAKRQEETHRTVMQLLTDQNKSTQTTLQQFFEKTQSTQSDFFAAMQQLSNESKTAQAQNFQQLIALMVMGHNQNMEFLRASNERERDQNNPMLMCQLLIQGLQMGKELGMESDQDPWIAALKEGGGMLDSLVRLKSGSAPTPPNLPNPVQPPKLPTTVSQTGTPPKPKRKSPFSIDELKAVANLKHMLSQKGLELTDVIDQIQFVYQPPDDPIPGGEEESGDFPDENGDRGPDSDDNRGDSESEQSDDTDV